jgi:hypothetical protein
MPMRFTDFAGFDASDFGDRGVSFRRARHLELHQHVAQIALVARQRSVQQQRALGLVELQEARERINVLFNQRRLLLERLCQPCAGRGQRCQNVFRRVLGVLVKIEKQGSFFVGTTPYTEALQEFARPQLLLGAPEVAVLAASLQKFAQAREHRLWPHKVLACQRHQAVQIAADVELGALLGRQGQHEVRAHQIEHRGFEQSGRREQRRALVGERGIVEQAFDHEYPPGR